MKRSSAKVKLNTLSDQRVRQEMARIDEILRVRFQRNSNQISRTDEALPTGERICWADPAEELMRKEEADLRHATVDALEVAQRVFNLEQIPEVLADQVRQLVFDTFREYESALMEWMFAAGPHPLEVMKRLFAYAKKRDARLVWGMGFREIGPLLGETHAASAARCRALFGDVPSGWDKTSSSRENMRKSQMGNRNRLGGKKLSSPALSETF